MSVARAWRQKGAGAGWNRKRGAVLSGASRILARDRASFARRALGVVWQRRLRGGMCHPRAAWRGPAARHDAPCCVMRYGRAAHADCLWYAFERTFERLTAGSCSVVRTCKVVAFAAFRHSVLSESLKIPSESRIFRARVISNGLVRRRMSQNCVRTVFRERDFAHAVDIDLWALLQGLLGPPPEQKCTKCAAMDT